MKKLEHTKLTLDFTKANVRRVTSRKDGTACDFVGADVYITDGKGNRDFHDAVIEPLVWDSIAGVATANDVLEVDGTLCIPELGEDKYKELTYENGHVYVPGHLYETRPVKFIVKSEFPGAKLPKYEDLRIAKACVDRARNAVS